MRFLYFVLLVLVIFTFYGCRERSDEPSKSPIPYDYGPHGRG